MRIIVMSKNNFARVDLQNVSSITFANDTYTITTTSTTYTYAAADWLLMIIN